jgi:hypothetical protein
MTSDEQRERLLIAEQIPRANLEAEAGPSSSMPTTTPPPPPLLEEDGLQSRDSGESRVCPVPRRP